MSCFSVFRPRFFFLTFVAWFECGLVCLERKKSGNFYALVETESRHDARRCVRVFFLLSIFGEFRLPMVLVFYSVFFRSGHKPIKINQTQWRRKWMTLFHHFSSQHLNDEKNQVELMWTRTTLCWSEKVNVFNKQTLIICHSSCGFFFVFLNILNWKIDIDSNKLTISWSNRIPIRDLSCNPKAIRYQKVVMRFKRDRLLGDLPLRGSIS